MKRVAYVSSANLREAADQLPSNIGRSSLVHSLIDSLDLISEDPEKGKAWLVDALPATKKDLTRFHASDYVHLPRSKRNC
jgi:acetoin utilization deacetylase AcuC-like enzyme